MGNLPTADEVTEGLRDAVSFAAKVPTSVFYVGPHSTFSYGGLLLNNRRALERYWVDEATGFDDADLRVEAEANVQEDGETPLPGFYGGRTMTFTGEIQAGSYPQVAVMSRALQDAFLDLTERALVISTIADPDQFMTMPDAQIWARKADKLQLSSKIQPADVQGTLRRAFTIALHATDPRFTSVEVHTANLVPLVLSQLGRTYDRGYDLAYTTLMDAQGNPSTSGNQITVRNTGNWPARPILRFNGPMGGISLTNNANGQSMRLLNAIASGEWIEVDTDLGVVYDRLGNPAGSMFDTSSDWMRLAPASGPYGVANGDNVLSLAVTTFSTGASVDITWNDTNI